MLVQIEQTPNDNALKFITGSEVLPAGVSFKSYSDAEDAENSPLAAEILKIDAVVGVFLTNEFITVSKHSDDDWNDLKTQVISIIMDFHSRNAEIYIDKSKKIQSSDEIDKTVQMIKQVLDERIRPAVAQDGGDIIFEKYENNILYVKMLGACDGCPSSTMTLQVAVDRVIKHFVPEVKEIRAS